MRILVTGATGFMGQNLVPVIRNRGNEVILLVRNREKAKKIFGEEYEISDGDLENPLTIKDCCANIDVVVNLAALGLRICSS